MLSGDEMELGLGAHGEAGVKRVPVDTAKGSVKTMLSHMTNPGSATHLPLEKGDQVAVLLNNLGSMSNLVRERPLTSYHAKRGDILAKHLVGSFNVLNRNRRDK